MARARAISIFLISRAVIRLMSRLRSASPRNPHSSSAFLRASFLASPFPKSDPTMTFSTRLSPGRGRTSWKVLPMPRWHLLWAGISLTSRPFKKDFSLRGKVDAGDDVDEGRLPRPVRADDPQDLVFPELHADPGQGGQPAEMPG